MDGVIVLDWVLAPGVLLLSALVLNVRDLFASIVLFIVFGLVMATTWVRLGAIDIALAEAAIGAGITGALLLNALGDMSARTTEAPARSPSSTSALSVKRRLLAAILVAPVALILGFAVLSAPAELDQLRPRVGSAIARSGVEHEVTAVLLSFRAYDTLLELAVLLLAVIGAWALRLSFAPRRPPPRGLMLATATRLVVPLSVLVAGYLLWRGSHAAGGAFQAAAVLAGGAVLLHLGLPSAWPRELEPAANFGLIAGLLVFTLAGLTPTLSGHPFLFYRGAVAEITILLIEAAATLSIALALVAMYLGRAHWEPREPDR